MEKVEIKNLCREFKLSRKQQKDKKTSDKILIAVNNVSFSLKNGEIYGLLGPNGAGKTTTLRMLSTLIKPTSGKIFFDDINIKDNEYEIKKEIGFLTSELKLDEFFTPDYLFDYFSDLYLIDKNVKNKRKEELFTKFGINEFRFKKVGELSTGMKQKVSLAISLAHNPSFIIFDEPTNGLDIIASKAVEDYLIELKKEGKMIIISTHIFSLVEKLCDRVGIIINGKLVYEDEMANIKENNNVETIFFDLYKKYGDKENA